MTFGDIIEQEQEQSSEKIDGQAVLSEFNQWKEIIMNIDVNVDEIPAYKKKLQTNPDDEEAQEKLEQLYKKLRFDENL